ncbi:unnamed protein product [Arctia plantaginis]|uniref:Uncharacterized protein n=1 Tax=Arctia plantaginis TaxID=874455 RepID=A0A8S1AN63_ARCPL|nr:unnamed protein product [Arctia plantaginis]
MHQCTEIRIPRSQFSRWDQQCPLSVIQETLEVATYVVHEHPCISRSAPASASALCSSTSARRSRHQDTLVLVGRHPLLHQPSAPVPVHDDHGTKTPLYWSVGTRFCISLLLQYQCTMITKTPVPGPRLQDHDSRYTAPGQRF